MNKFRRIIIGSLCLMFLYNIDTVYARVKHAKPNVRDIRQEKNIRLVESNPENIDAHHKFISEAYSQDQMLRQYRSWMKITRFKKVSTFPFALGEFYSACNQPTASQSYLLKAVTLNPSLAKAWELLSENVMLSNKDDAQVYALKAVKIDPENPGFAVTYALTFKNTDKLKFDSLLLSVVNHFPASEQTFRALSLLANNTNNIEKKIGYYDTMFKSSFVLRSELLNYELVDYFHLLLCSNPQKAAELAQEMSVNRKAAHLDKWRYKKIIAESLIKAQALISNRQADSAIAILDTIHLEKYYTNACTQLILLKAEATAAKPVDETMPADTNIKAAYDTLVRYYSKTPADTVRSAMFEYGSQLNLTGEQVMADVWKLRDLAAQPATDFLLQSYLEDKKVSLKDYNDKVKLVTYWFPSCGSCLSEFSHFESVNKSLGDKKIPVLALNLAPEENSKVLPLYDAQKYTFTPLHDNNARKKGNMPANGAPTSYLIDQNGKIIFSGFMINDQNEGMLRLMISELLSRNQQQYLTKTNTSRNPEE